MARPIAARCRRAAEGDGRPAASIGVYVPLPSAIRLPNALPAPGGTSAACPLLVYAELPGNASAPIALLCTLGHNGYLGEPRGLVLAARLGLAPSLYSGDLILGVGVKTFQAKTVCLKILGYTASCRGAASINQRRR